MERRLSGSIALHKMQSAIIKQKEKSGEVEGIFIPIDNNKLFRGKDGAIYLNIDILLKDQNDQYNNCAMISKRVDMGKKWSELSDAEKETKKGLEPILGNLKEFGSNNTTATTPTTAEVTTYGSSDLPF